MNYVYVLQSTICPEKKYIGCTRDLKKRLSIHNLKKSTHTAKYVPWKLVSYVAVENKSKAYELEAYLKTASGRGFILKRLL